jgi:hypothetical protein
MKIKPATSSDLKQRLADSLGIEQSSHEGLVAELLRNELAARRVSSRRGLCCKIATLIDSFCPVELDFIKEQLLSLERSGEVTDGPGGQVAAAPILAVKLANDRYQLFGTVNYNQLTAMFPDSHLSAGLSRILILKGSDLNKFGQMLDNLGGLELSPERWAGMDKVRAANQEWLDELNCSVARESRPAGSLEKEIQNEWRVYQPDKAVLLQKARWQKQTSSGKGYLWRTWHERGWPIYAWTAGNSPDEENFVRLSGDVANRTMFALDRVEGAEISCKLSTKDEETHLEIGGFLPKAEYRFLAIKGAYTGKDGDYFSFKFEPSIWPDVCEVLNKRLGIPG